MKPHIHLLEINIYLVYQTYQNYRAYKKLGTFLDSFQKFPIIKLVSLSNIFHKKIRKKDTESRNFAIVDEVAHNFVMSDDDMGPIIVNLEFIFSFAGCSFFGSEHEHLFGFQT